MNRDKDEFWAITDPDGAVTATVNYTRIGAIADLVGGLKMVKGRNQLTEDAKGRWQSVYRQGYRARRVRVEVI